ncbi:hypothetical protein LQ567_01945 [Niabella pedocola]|uniref:BioF2-like acetyltransferase domain-containing protein n=1 Tax=Niabella pedocola TaxID=1752077 RepID=A0ABS8PNY1_9BACT|nr:hypothetical protein [Niabella pedocola]MCD2421506.1 hypothetical protein [Niabella pedocola]
MEPNHPIRFYNREAIDTDRWDAFVKKSSQFRIYALSTWLDHFTPRWGALIDDGYSMVMPLPCKRKYGIRYLAQPRFTQQLGFYTQHPEAMKTKDAFLQQAMRLFPFGDVWLNTPVENVPSFERRNYVLSLKPSYTEIYQQYSKSLVHNSLKPALKQQLIYDVQQDIDNAITAYQQGYQRRMQLANGDYAQLKKLAVALSAPGNCFTRTVKDENGGLLAISLFFCDDQRIYNLCSATTLSGRKRNANYFLYDQLIREFSGSGLILDFEGSSIPGIAAFYRKFGAVPEPYYAVKWNHLRWPYTIFKK